MSDFRIRGFRHRLRAFLIGRVFEVEADLPPVIGRRTSSGWSLDTATIPSHPLDRYQPRPLLICNWRASEADTPQPESPAEGRRG